MPLKNSIDLALAVRTEAWWYADSPLLIAASTKVSHNSDGTVSTLNFGFDLLKDDVQVLPYPGQETSTVRCSIPDRPRRPGVLPRRPVFRRFWRISHPGARSHTSTFRECDGYSGCRCGAEYSVGGHHWHHHWKSCFSRYFGRRKGPDRDRRGRGRGGRSALAAGQFRRYHADRVARAPTGWNHGRRDRERRSRHYGIRFCGNPQRRVRSGDPGGVGLLRGLPDRRASRRIRADPAQCHRVERLSQPTVVLVFQIQRHRGQLSHRPPSARR